MSGWIRDRGLLIANLATALDAAAGLLGRPPLPDSCDQARPPLSSEAVAPQAVKAKAASGAAARWL
ncbi:MAG: hypothetical protein ACR2FE_10975 [Aeromicrobium sp.]